MNLKTLTLFVLFFSVNMSKASGPHYQTDTAHYNLIYEFCVNDVDEIPLPQIDLSEPNALEALHKFAHLSETDAYKYFETIVIKCLNGKMAADGVYDCNSHNIYAVYLTLQAIQKHARQELKRANSLLRK